MRLQPLGIEIKSWTLTWTKTTWGEAKGVLLPGHVPVLSSDLLEKPGLGCSTANGVISITMALRATERGKPQTRRKLGEKHP